MYDAGAIDALTAKVDELAGICASLSRENAELRNQLSALSAADAPVADQAIGHAANGTHPASHDPGLADGAGAPRFSRRAAVGVALAGAAAGIVGAAAVTEWNARPAAPDATMMNATSAQTAEAAELTVADVAAAAPTATGSVINATLSTASAVLAGANTSTGAGVSATNSSTGPGVQATSSHGRGGIFAGSGAAQIQLTPGAASHPKSGQRGDLYADSNGRLWFCKKTGATATWHQIA